LVAELNALADSLRLALRAAEPGQSSGDEALLIVARFAEIERMAGSGVALFSPVVVATGSYAKEGHGSAQQWLGALEGSSNGVAKGRLASAERAAITPALTEALHAGELSTDQLNLVAKTAAEVTDAAGTLLLLAQSGASHMEMSDVASRLLAADRQRETERTRRARVHTRRHFRWHQSPAGGIRGEFLCDEVEWAKVFPKLDAAAKGRWKAAGSKDGASLEAHRLDAFIDLMSGSSGGDSSARVETLILIDAEALRRGTTQGDELCEVEGIGPISVAAATELLTEGGLRYLVKEGFDVRTVTKSTRDIAKCIDAALIVRDRTCCAGHCGKRKGLERDHVHVDYADDGPTSLDNLVRLCPEHHALKTYSGWTIGGQPGNWSWVAPARPKSAGAISRSRKVATARNNPMRT
jgi:hypothetical protein